MFRQNEQFASVRKPAYRLALAVALVGYGSSAFAQTPGTFSATGKMTTPRVDQTATLLADGRVLIAGGDMMEGTSFKTLSSAELYDPRTGTFTATGNMTTPRAIHTATLLRDGRVLIVGGGITSNNNFASPALASAELYDPSTGTFSAVANMTVARTWNTATLLPNGKVLIAGGIGPPTDDASGGEFLRSAELYDPSTGTFTPTGDMTSVTADTATLLQNGKVLITRSLPDGPNPLFYAELYDPSTGTFTGTGNMINGHTGPTATLLPNGKVLVAGGDVGDGDGASYSAELYDPATGTFALAGSMIVGREQHTATLLIDGTVLMAGGHSVPVLAATAEVYDPVHGTFSATANMAGPRELHTATLLNDGRVLIAGGDDERYSVPETILATAELYCPVTVNCPPDPWQQAMAAMKSAAGTDSLNFYQWAWYWQTIPAFSGAPAGFGVAASISPVVMEQITVAGGGNPLLNVSAEQWVSYFRQVTQ